MSVAKLASTNAFVTAKEAGMATDEAKRRAKIAAAKARAALAIDDPIRAVIEAKHRTASQAIAEARRLRRERDGLLIALADALGVAESEAWLIARLDMEDPDA